MLVGAVLLVVLPAQDAGSQPPAQTFTVSGTIANASGERLRPARAILRREGDPAVSATTWSSTKEGLFTIVNVAPGEYRLFLEALPFETLQGRPIRHFAGVRVTVTADVTDLKIVAVPGVTLQGRVVSPDPAPDLRNLWVVAVGADGRAAALAMVGPEGRFTLAEVFGAVRIDVSSLPEGHVVKAVMLGDTDITGQPIEVTPDETRELQVMLERPVCRKEQTRPTVRMDADPGARNGIFAGIGRPTGGDTMSAERLDDAIASAVTEFGRQCQEVADFAATRDVERWGVFSHEVRNLVNTALLSFEVLKTGSVGMGGSTAGVLSRSLSGLHALVNQSLTDVRVTQSVQRHDCIMVPDFMREIESTAAFEARSRGVRFAVEPSEEGIAIGGDRQVLAAVMMNLLQNAFKFTRPNTTVILRAGASAERVFFEIEDECGGLPGANPHEQFRPFEQRSTDRSGIGLGLTFCRWGAEAQNGRVHARSLPDKGCIFTVDLPRLLTPVGV